MKKPLVFYIVIFLSVHYTRAQIVFQKTFTALYCTHLDVTSDDGYIFSGVDTLSDAFLLKTDSAGTVDWIKSYAGPNSDEANSVQQTDDGGYIATGSAVIGTGMRLLLLKTNSSGDTLWTKDYGNQTNSYWGTFVNQTSDHGYIIVAQGYDGNLNSPYLFRTDSVGNLLWNYEYAGYTSVLNNAWQTSDGGFITSGYDLTSFPGIHLIKTDSSGTVLWRKLFRIPSNQYGTGALAIDKTMDGGFIIAGRYSNVITSTDACYLIKTNSTGDTLWTKAYLAGAETAGSVHQTPDGGYIVGGEMIDSGSVFTNIFALKTDSTGNVTWMRKYKAEGYERFKNMELLADGGYLILGSTASSFSSPSSMYLIKTDPNGISGCMDSVLNPAVFVPYMPNDAINFFSAGSVTTGIPVFNINSMNVQVTTLCSSSVNMEEPYPDEIKIFQNPFTISTTFDLGNNEKRYEFSLYNELGKCMQNAENISGRYELKRGSLSSGIYFYRFYSKEKIFSGKVIIQ